MSILSNKQKAVAVLNAIENGDAGAFAHINPTKYIQHNLSLVDGVAGIGATVRSVPVGTLKARVVRAFEDGDFVFTHTEYDFFGPKVGFDVFRFEDGKIVEHWDNLIETRTRNRSGRTQIDGHVDIADLDRTAANKQIVRDFVMENWLLGGDTYDRYIQGDVYLQHNPDGADGLLAFREVLAYFGHNDIAMRFTKLHKVLGEGNFVLVMSEGLFGQGAGVPTSFYDMFRLENGAIVEHWDVIEEIAPRSAWKNGNGKF
ncbi:MAG: nuclear transport factor 2 family protein [Pseudomonadota bacterium]